MNQLRLWALSLCSAAAVAALLQMLLPQKAQNRAATTVVNLFLLLCVAAPLAQLWPLSALPSSDWRAIDSPDAPTLTADQLIVAQIETRLVALIEEKLQGMGINPISVRIDITVSQDSFSIDGVAVTAGGTPDAHSAAARQLSQELGLPVDIAGEHEVTS